MSGNRLHVGSWVLKAALKWQQMYRNSTTSILPIAFPRQNKPNSKVSVFNPILCYPPSPSPDSNCARASVQKKRKGSCSGLKCSAVKFYFFSLVNVPKWKLYCACQASCEVRTLFYTRRPRSSEVIPTTTARSGTHYTARSRFQALHYGFLARHSWAAAYIACVDRRQEWRAQSDPGCPEELMSRISLGISRRLQTAEFNDIQ